MHRRWVLLNQCNVDPSPWIFQSNPGIVVTNLEIRGNDKKTGRKSSYISWTIYSDGRICLFDMENWVKLISFSFFFPTSFWGRLTNLNYWKGTSQVENKKIQDSQKLVGLPSQSSHTCTSNKTTLELLRHFLNLKNLHPMCSIRQDLLNKTVKIEFNPPATSIIILGNQNLENRRRDCIPKTVESILELHGVNLPTSISIKSFKYGLQVSAQR